jgi:hypothetical protein
MTAVQVFEGNGEHPQSEEMAKREAAVAARERALAAREAAIALRETEILNREVEVARRERTAGQRDPLGLPLGKNPWRISPKPNTNDDWSLNQDESQTWSLAVPAPGQRLHDLTSEEQKTLERLCAR